jgi:hypothetical protein
MPTTWQIKRSHLYLFVVTIAAYLAVRLWTLTAYDLWLDEVFSVQTARQPWAEMMSLLVADVVHPPLFYALLKMWIAIGGESLLWLRILPLLFSIATLIPLVLLCRELRLSQTATVFALALTSCNGYLVYYAQEVRMYSLLVLLTSCSLLTFARYLNSQNVTRTLWITFSGVNVLMVYTHYYGWLVIGTECLFVLLFHRKRLLPLVLSTLVCGMLFAPWVVIVVEANSKRLDLAGLDWMARPTVEGFAWYYANLNGKVGIPRGATLSLFLSGAPILLWGWRIISLPERRCKETNQAFWFLVVFSFAPTVVAFLTSQVAEQSLWHGRGLLIISLPFVILTAAAASQLVSDWARRGVCALLLLGAVLSAHYRLTVLAEQKKIPWSNIAKRLSEAEEANGRKIKLYTLETDWGYCLDFHLDARHDSRFAISSVEGALAGEGAKPFFLRQFPSVTAGTFSTFDDNHFWLMFAESDWQRRGSQPQDMLRKVGYQIDTKLQDSQNRLTLISVWRRQNFRTKAGTQLGRATTTSGQWVGR